MDDDGPFTHEDYLRAEDRLYQALLYAEKLIRSSVASERMIGADLKQILEDS